MRSFIFLLLFSNSCFAKEIILDRTNNMGIRKIDLLKETKGIYLFNGKSLGNRLPPKVEASWQAVERGPKLQKRKARCFAGTYIYINKTSGSEYRRQGCAEGPGYGSLVQSLEEIRRHAKGR
ncbi:hypothetical protein [Bdellovibrio bacteriovorus]|uniref:hypothetical protein n=1 Tax=Bdellovibrio bacteriovorus TaxID=959 RepID=UPI00059FFC31|nr:hypothetical protein [Bdellovibrio bacteriovorus]